MNVLANRQTIVVGIDGSQQALGAALWAAAVADRMHAPLLLVNATADEYYYHYGIQAAIAYPNYADELRKAGQEMLDKASAAVAEQFPSVELAAKVYNGNPDHVIVDLSGRARLTVVGAHSRQALDALLGSTTLRVANHARGPVVVWRGDPEAALPESGTVLVGVDGEEMGEQALDYGFEVASLLNARLVALHAWSDDEEQASARLSESLAGRSEKYPDVEVDEIVQDGNPGTALLQWGKDAQLIVVGSRVRNRILANLLGSTSQNLLNRATVPILICHPLHR
ncbi:MAG: universal stress protein [Mycobacteriaceae bacterium]|nr:universal stress protein [Mycobacteriaceae bacterium]